MGAAIMMDAVIMEELLGLNQKERRASPSFFVG
jgi:hypothetical protein